MEGRIGRLHCNYRVMTEPAVASIALLERVGKDSLAAACTRALDCIADGDPAVWIMRRVSVPWIWNAKAQWDEGTLAAQWAKLISRAAIREIARGVDGANLVRFENQADLVACFITDLLRGQAWGKWFYGCFQRFRDEVVAAVAQKVLLENHEHVSEVMARLVKSGSLNPLLEVLGPEAAEQIWNLTLHGSTATTEEELRPVFAVALRIADAGRAGLPGTGDAAARWLREYAQSNPSRPDWRDRSGLTLAVIGAIEFLWRQGYLDLSKAGIREEWKKRAKESMRDSDWLDIDMLGSALTRFASATKKGRVDGAAGSLLRPDLATPRVRRLISHLAEAIAALIQVSPEMGFNAPARALRLYSRLISQHPEWSGDLLAQGAVDGLTATADWLRATDAEWVSKALDDFERRVIPSGLHAAEWNEAVRSRQWDILRQFATRRKRLDSLSDEDTAGLSRLCILNELGRRASAVAPLKTLADAITRRETGNRHLRARAALQIYCRLISRHGGNSRDRGALRAIEGLVTAAEWIVTTGRIGINSFLAVSGRGGIEPGSLAQQFRDAIQRGGRDVASISSDLEEELAALTDEDAADLLRLCMLIGVCRGASERPGLDARSRRNLVRAIAARETGFRDLRVRAVLKVFMRLIARRSGSGPAEVTVDAMLESAKQIVATGPAWIIHALTGSEERAKPGTLARHFRAELAATRRHTHQPSATLESELAGLSDEDAADLLRLSVLDQIATRSASASPKSIRAIAAPMSASAWAIHVLEAAGRNQEQARLPTQFLRTFGDEGLDLAASVAAVSASAADQRVATLATGLDTRCAGVFLLIRAMAGIRLASIAGQAGYPLAPCILMLGICWGGDEAISQEQLDTGIGILAGQGADMTMDELRAIWQQVDPVRHIRFQERMMDALVSHRMLQGSAVEIHRLTLPAGGFAVVLGCGRVWPLVRIVKNGDDEREALAEMSETWRAITQENPEFTPADEEASRALREALNALGTDHLHLPLADLTLALASISLLRSWAAWLRQFSNSSVPYLLRNFIRRPGRIVHSGDGLLVEMPHMPLDIVIEMAGYVAPFEARSEPWECRVAFNVRESW